MLTLGVVKKIIPAVASSNSIIAGICTNEVLKILTGCSLVMDNYLQYMGHSGIYSHTVSYEREKGCPICSSTPQTIKLRKSMKLKELVQILKEKPFDLPNPSIIDDVGNYLVPPVMKELHADKLEKTFEDLI